MEEHVLQLRSRLIERRTSRFWGECSCGWVSVELPSAGTVHSEHARHIDELTSDDDAGES